MPHIILLLGILLGGFALFHFMRSATAREMAALVLTFGVLLISGVVFFLAITGRLPIALGVLSALWPAGVAVWKSRQHTQTMNNTYRKTTAPPDIANLPRREALDILGLAEGATAEEIKAAHKRLIKALHPDGTGSEWLARKINAARDVLLQPIRQEDA